MYVLQMTTNGHYSDSSVVLGVYETNQAMTEAALNHYKENRDSAGTYFYDIKQVNSAAKWTNEQMEILL